jgi:hypothetical protein
MMVKISSRTRPLKRSESLRRCRGTCFERSKTLCERPPVMELARLLLRLDHIARVIVNADDSVM